MTRLARVTGGLLVSGLWVYAVSRLALTTPWLELGELLRQDVRPRPGAWRLLRGGLDHLALPALAVGTLVLVGDAWRRDRASALLCLAGVLTTNVVVQGMKHGQVAAPDGVNPLSGHVGVAAGIGLCWLAASGGRGGAGHRGRAVQVLVVGLMAGGMPVAVLLTGWHTLVQVLVPVGIATGCAMAVGAGRGRPPEQRPLWPRSLLAVGALATGVALLSAHHWAAEATQRPVWAGALSTAVAAAASACAIALVALGSDRRP